MTTPVSTTDTGAQDAVTGIENLISAGETSAETAIIASNPSLGTPIVKQIWEALFDWFVSLLEKPLATYGGYVIVDLQEYAALRNAVTAQAALDIAKKTGDSHAITQASSNVDAALAGVINYIGATRA